MQMLLQQVGTRSQVWVEYNIIPYTSTPITLPYLCQGYHGHCIITSSDGGDGKVGAGSFMLRFGEDSEDREWVSYFLNFCSVFVLLLILSWLVHDSLLCLFHCSFFAFFDSGPFN